jgi:hypothetical protein
VQENMAKHMKGTNFDDKINIKWTLDYNTI